MDILDGLDGWSLPDTLQLLLLRKADNEWSDIAIQLKNRFGQKDKENFYTEKCCKERFAHILSSPHPEHFLRNKGKKYSHKDLVQAWIVFLERKLVEERKKKQQLLMVQFREKLVLFNKLFDDKCSFSNERILQLLEEARKEDSKCDPRFIEKGIAQILPKIQELNKLHLSKPDTYGCLRLVVNVPQLCEMAECNDGDGGRQVISESELGLPTVSKTIEETAGDQSLEQRKTVMQFSTLRTAKTFQSPSSSREQEIAQISESSVANNGQLSTQKVAVLQHRDKDLQHESTSSVFEFCTPVSTVSPSSNISSISNITKSGKDSESIAKGNDTGIQIKLEPEAVESDTMESSNYLTEASKDLSRVSLNESVVTPQPSDSSSTASCTVGTAVAETVENIKLETSEESRSIETSNKSEKQLSGKRQLRNSKKESEIDASPNSTDSTSKSQRCLSGRIPLVEMESLSPDISSQEDKKRTTVVVGVGRAQETEVTGCMKTADSEVSSDKNTSADQTYTDEEVEKLNSKRRSDRLRTSEASFEQTDLKPTVLRRKASNVVESQDEEFPVTAKKKRRLGTENVQNLSESSQTSAKKISDHIDGSEKRSGRSEILNLSNKKDKKSNSAEIKGSVTEVASRRSSLRSAAQTMQEISRKEAVNTDSDEEKTLVDIRDKHRTPRKQVNDVKSTRGKEDDTTLKKRLLNEDESTKKLSETSSDVTAATSKKGRGSLRRSSTATQKGEGTSPKKQADRKHPKRREADDGSTEKKIFLMSAWRLVSSHRHAAIFAHPVSERDAQGYSVTVKRRMDLSTLKRNVESGEVRDLAEFKRRLLLMFANAVMFNSTGHDVNIYAKEMALDTLTSLKDLEKDILYVRGGTHVTRRSAAFAAEEERRKTLNSSSTFVPKVTGAKDIPEDLSNNMATTNVPKTLSSRRSMSKLR